MDLLKRFLWSVAVVLWGVIATPVAAQVYVQVLPVRPRVPSTYHRPPRPVNGFWIEEDWRVRGDRYEYHGRRWATAPRVGMIWRSGRWKTASRKGYVWVPGRWVSRKYY